MDRLSKRTRRMSASHSRGISPRVWRGRPQAALRRRHGRMPCSARIPRRRLPQARRASLIERLVVGPSIKRPPVAMASAGAQVMLRIRSVVGMAFPSKRLPPRRCGSLWTVDEVGDVATM